MDEFIHFIMVCTKLGLGLCVAVVLVVYIAYGTESHCWHPTGCINNSQEARDMAWSADHADPIYGK